MLSSTPRPCGSPERATGFRARTAAPVGLGAGPGRQGHRGALRRAGGGGHDLGTYLRGEAGGGLLVGGAEPACDPLQWVDDPDAVDIHPTAEVFEAQVTRAARRLPDLAVPRSWGS
ncbi:hypothetical protein [Amycolatopsis plumensis]|uniref:hypothetical protein n=1 Tax=Amycolatopsis plumensis TaxID=236508 RepID=UPI00361B79FF